MDNIPSLHIRYLLQDHYDTIAYFGKKIRDVSKEMEAATADDPVVQKLLDQPGIGTITAITMRALIGRFDRFRTGKQLAHFCAVCPRNNSSAGKTTTGGLIKAGDDLLRQVLIEAAHRLMRYNDHWRETAQRLAANGKKKCVIVAAVANRWIRKLFHQMAGFQPSPGGTPGFLRHGQKNVMEASSSGAGPLGLPTPESHSFDSVIPSSVAPQQSRRPFRGTKKV